VPPGSACRGDVYVRYDGAGLKADGIYCYYDGKACYTDIAYFDGTGVRNAVETTDYLVDCPSVGCLDYVSGSGLKVLTCSATCGVV